MSLSTNWKQFQLFDYTPIRDPNFKSTEPLYSDSSLTGIHATTSWLVIATNNCVLKLINPTTFQLEKLFIAYDVDYTISFIRSLPNSNLLITLAEKQGAPSLIKLWDLTKIVHLVEEEEYKFKFQAQAKISNGDNSYPISCFEFNYDLTCLGIGYTNGKVIIVRGDMLRDRGTKQRLIYESHDPITGLHFNTSEDLLYVTTTSKVLTIQTNGRNQGKPTKILSNNLGVDLYCSDIDLASQNLIVGNGESLLFYNHTTKLNTLPFKCAKSKVYKVQTTNNENKNYLCLISSYDEDIDGVNQNKKKKLITRVIILDLHNTHISFNLMIPNNFISHIFEMQKNLYLLSNEGMLYKISEKAIDQQIDSIVERELFPIAYNLALQNKLDPELLLRIQRSYGDYLYERQDFEQSINTFMKCLALYQKLDADSDLDDFIMNIITKFKDVANIQNLSSFLLRLYELKIAKNDHVSLLLCCYCKLKLTKELDDFINNLNIEENSFQDLNFQLIINLFKECGFLTQVINLLYKLNQPSLIVDIQLNDLFQPKVCLKFIKTLTIDDMLLILIDHSKTLLDYLPIETTELLINVFTGKYVPNVTGPITLKDEEAYQSVAEKVSSTLTSYTAFLSYLSAEEEQPSEEALEPTYLPPRPSLIYPSFINHAYEFVIFLEACVETFEKYQGTITDKKELLITLLEMYLSLSEKLKRRRIKTGDVDDWKEKAQTLINKNSNLLDSTSLLLVSHIYGFKEGEALAKEQSGYEESLFRSYQIARDFEGCLYIVKKYGDEKPDLYKLMLLFAISDREIFEQCPTTEFNYILEKINKLKLMTPLELLQNLTSDPAKDYLSLGLIKDYLVDHIQNQTKEINNNFKLIEYYETESTKNSHKLTELVSKPFIIQNNKCSECGLKLDFPVVHFVCKHSFHQKCLADNLVVSAAHDAHESSEKKCPRCINELDEIGSVRNGFTKARDDVELFEVNLNDSTDRFKFMSEQLSKGVMENESVLID